MNHGSGNYWQTQVSEQRERRGVKHRSFRLIRFLKIVSKYKGMGAVQMNENFNQRGFVNLDHSPDTMILKIKKRGGGHTKRC